MLRKTPQHKGPAPLAAWALALGEELEAARDHLAAGETDKAEKRAKAISLLARAARDVAELAAAGDGEQEDDVEALRAELRARLARYTEAEQSGAFFDEPDGRSDARVVG